MVHGQVIVFIVALMAFAARIFDLRVMKLLKMILKVFGIGAWLVLAKGAVVKCRLLARSGIVFSHWTFRRWRRSMPLHVAFQVLEPKLEVAEEIYNRHVLTMTYPKKLRRLCHRPTTHWTWHSVLHHLDWSCIIRTIESASGAVSPTGTSGRVA